MQLTETNTETITHTNTYKPQRTEAKKRNNGTEEYY